jgi:hypothetical protein
MMTMVGTPADYREQAIKVLRECEERLLDKKACVFCDEFTDEYVYVCGLCQEDMYDDRLFHPAFWIEDMNA